MGTTAAATGAGAHEQRALPDRVLTWLERPPGRLVAVVATVDPDGTPRTATFGTMRAVSPTVLRFGCRPTNRTYANIRRSGHVMVALHGPPDVAVGIAGHARIVRDRLDAWPDNALIQVDVTSVKDDQHPELPIATAITYTVPDDLVDMLDAVNTELRAP